MKKQSDKNSATTAVVGFLATMFETTILHHHSLQKVRQAQHKNARHNSLSELSEKPNAFIVTLRDLAVLNCWMCVGSN